MTVEEIEIIVTAKVEEALKEFQKIVPTIKQTIKQAQDTFSKVDTKTMQNKLNQAVQFMKKKIQDFKKSSENNEIAIKVNNKDAQKQINQIQKQIDSLQEKISARQLKLNTINPQIDKIVDDTRKSVTPDGISLSDKSMDTVVNNALSSNKDFTLLNSQAQKLYTEIEMYNKQLNEAKNKMSQLGQETSQTATTQNKLSSFFGAFKQKVDQVKPSIASMKNNFKGLPKVTQNITNNIKGMGKGIKSGLGHVMRYAMALFSLRGIYSVLSSSAQGWLSSQNAGAQQLSANIEYLKNSLGSALAPALEFITNLAYQLMKAIQSLVYAFSGINIFAKATASSMNKTAGSAKQASKSLTGVHNEINNVSENKDSGGSGTTSPTMDLSQVDNSMTAWANKWKQKLSKFFEPLKKAWENQGQQTIDKAKNALDKIKESITAMRESWSQVWNNGTGQQTIELILSIFQNIFDTIGNIAEAWQNAWNTDNKGTQLIQSMWDALNKLFNLIKVLTEKIKEFTSSPVVQEYFENAIEMVTNFWNALSGILEFLTGIFTGDWELAWKGLKKIVSAIFELIWNCIKEKLIMIKAFIFNSLKTISTIWSTIWEDIKKKASEIWDKLLEKVDNIFPGMRNIIETNITNIKNKITEKLGEIKTKWNNIWDRIKTKTSEVWNNIWTAIKNPINWILNGVEKMANGVVTGVNKVIRSLNNMHFKMPDWLGGGSFGINIPTMSYVSIPRLAKGNVAYSPLVAQFGEYAGASRNPEITAPQNILRQTFDDVLSDHEWNRQSSSGLGELRELVIYFGSTRVALEIERLLQQARRQNGTATVTI